MSAPLEDIEFDVESVDVDNMDMGMVNKPKLLGKSTKTVASAVSDLTSSDDPFAPREGKTLLWRGVNMTLVR